MTCGGRLPVCDVAPIHAAPPMPCHSCRGYAVDALVAAGFSPRLLREFVDISAISDQARTQVSRLITVKDLMDFEHDGMPIGRWVRASVVWFLSRGTLAETKETLVTYRRFIVSGRVLVEGFTKMLDEVRPGRIFLVNASFFPERILGELAVKRGIPVTWYEKGFLTDSLILGQWTPGTDLLDPGDAAWQAIARSPLLPEQEAELDAYLQDRVAGERTFDNFWADREEDLDSIRRELVISDGRPLISLFSNLVWDSAIQDQDLGFSSLQDWVLASIRWAGRQPGIDLVIRLHPAEVRLSNHVTLEPMSDVIDEEFPNLPRNVRVIPSTSNISSYTLMRASTVGLVYSSTSGLEMATLGVPVAPAAATHYSRRGFTYDASTREEYWATVERLIASPTTPADRARISDLARRYAYLFWFRHHHMMDVVYESGRSNPEVGVASADDLRPGRNLRLDTILDIILQGDPASSPNPTGHSKQRS